LALELISECKHNGLQVEVAELLNAKTIRNLQPAGGKNHVLSIERRLSTDLGRKRI
jgi:hypothetical protein